MAKYFYLTIVSLLGAILYRDELWLSSTFMVLVAWVVIGTIASCFDEEEQ